MSLPPDDELVARLRDGDDSAFALMLDAWSDGLLRLARSFVSTHDSAAGPATPGSQRARFPPPE